MFDAGNFLANFDTRTHCVQSTRNPAQSGVFRICGARSERG